jgi:hypothetical protein
MKNALGKNEDLELFNEQGKKVYEYFTDSSGYGYEHTFDKNGNTLTYKDSHGYWREYTRDENGKELTYKDSDGKTRGFDIPEYTMEELVQKLGNFKLIKNK